MFVNVRCVYLNLMGVELKSVIHLQTFYLLQWHRQLRGDEDAGNKRNLNGNKVQIFD